jgi:hypothetical protein
VAEVAEVRVEPKPRDHVVWDKTTYARLNFGWNVSPEHTLELSLAPTYVTRTGDERRQLDPTALDPQTASRSLFSFVSGIEQRSTFVDGQLENIAFIKDYVQLARAQEALIGSSTFRDLSRDTHRLGFGDSLRYRFLSWLYGKVSYEWATRLPSTYETFGDGVLVVENIKLEPEASHNGNIGLTVDARNTGYGDFRVDTNGFIRSADNAAAPLRRLRRDSAQDRLARARPDVDRGARLGALSLAPEEERIGGGVALAARAVRGLDGDRGRGLVNDAPPAPSQAERKDLTARRVWGMPIALTVLSSVALVIGLLADGVADVVADVGLGIPVVVAGWHVVRALRGAGAR